MFNIKVRIEIIVAIIYIVLSSVNLTQAGGGGLEVVHNSHLGALQLFLWFLSPYIGLGGHPTPIPLFGVESYYF